MSKWLIVGGIGSACSLPLTVRGESMPIATCASLPPQLNPGAQGGRGRGGSGRCAHSPRQILVSLLAGMRSVSASLDPDSISRKSNTSTSRICRKRVDEQLVLRAARASSTPRQACQAGGAVSLNYVVCCAVATSGSCALQLVPIKGSPDVLTYMG